MIVRHRKVVGYMNANGRVAVTILLILNILGCLGFYYFIQMNLLQNVWVRAALICFLFSYFVMVWRLGKKYDQVKDHATKDPLTGVYNRRFTHERFRKLLTQANKKDQRLIVMMIDISNFKMVNDTFGHKIGDLVLQKVSQMILDQTIRGDIVARWGGDEFLFISKRASPEFIQEFRQRLQAKFEELSKELGQKIDFSMGVTMFPDDARNLEELMQLADFSKYRYKTFHRDISEKNCMEN